MTGGWKHIEINDHGTIVVLRPISDEGREWFARMLASLKRAGFTPANLVWRRTFCRLRRAIFCLGNERPPRGRRGGGQQSIINQAGSL
jgi:hypothetical protein